MAFTRKVLYGLDAFKTWITETFAPKSHPHGKEDIPADTVYFTEISQSPAQIPDPALQNSNIFYDNISQ